MKNKILVYLAMIIMVPLAGELKLYPFEENVRVSLGTPVFFFFLLWSRQMKPILSGIHVGAAVVLFRVAHKVIGDGMLFEDALELHFPVFFYYFVFAMMFQFFKIKKFYERPLMIGLFGIIMEIIATFTEMGIRSFHNQVEMSVNSTFTIGVIAIIRSFFVLGFFNLIVIRESRIAATAQQRRNEQMLVHISNLYVEMIQLKKTMKNTEDLTSAGYCLYRDLKASGHNEFAKTALKFAGEIHEIKKDNQRIYAGLSKLMAKEKMDDFMTISEIIHVIVTGNERYAVMLGKNIHFSTNIWGIHPSYNTFMLLSLINNLVANAVEAIEANGEIHIDAKMDLDMLAVQVKDNGSGISPRNRTLIFTPGFTTKFDHIGQASTGIGLSFVKDTIEEFGGSITLDEPEEIYKTVFTICLPIESLLERG